MLENIYFFYCHDQICPKVLHFFQSLVDIKLDICERILDILPYNEFEVDFYKVAVTGHTESHKFSIELDQAEKKVTVLEADENKVVKKETNFDNIVNTTFKLGLSDVDKQNRKKVKPPHFAMQDQQEDDQDGIHLVDEEQDAEDDVDV